MRKQVLVALVAMLAFLLAVTCAKSPPQASRAKVSGPRTAPTRRDQSRDSGRNLTPAIRGRIDDSWASHDQPFSPSHDAVARL